MVVVVVVDVVVVSRQAVSFDPAPKAVHPAPWRNSYCSSAICPFVVRLTLRNFMTAFLTKPLPADAEAFKNPTSNWKQMDVGILGFIVKYCLYPWFYCEILLVSLVSL